MRLAYRYNKAVIEISETPNEADVEFYIKPLTEEKWLEMKQLQRFFEDNSVYTDVLFYVYENNNIRVIVRRDYYVDFVLGLMSRQLLESVEWVN